MAIPACAPVTRRAHRVGYSMVWNKRTGLNIMRKIERIENERSSVGTCSLSSVDPYLDRNLGEALNGIYEPAARRPFDEEVPAKLVDSPLLDFKGAVDVVLDEDDELPDGDESFGADSAVSKRHRRQRSTRQVCFQ